MQRREAAQREERHVRHALPGQLVDERVIAAVREVIVVLHADDLGDGLRLRQLFGRDVAEADVPDQPFLCRSARTATCSAMDPSSGPWPDPDAVVDDLERVEAKIPEVIVDGRRSVPRVESQASTTCPDRGVRQA